MKEDNMNDPCRDEARLVSTDDVHTGIIKLRPMFDSRKNMWRITKKTENGSGGWARFGASWDWDRQSCIDRIRRIIANYPDQYEMD